MILLLWLGRTSFKINYYDRVYVQHSKLYTAYGLCILQLPRSRFTWRLSHIVISTMGLIVLFCNTLDLMLGLGTGFPGKNV